MPEFAVSAESITLYRYESDGDVRVINHETGENKNGFYDLEALKITDKYRVFLGGNYSHLSIKSSQKKPTLLLVKDSFANSLIPFLALHYDIEVIDPRYCAKTFLNEQLQSNSYDRILALLSLDTLESIQ